MQVGPKDAGQVPYAMTVQVSVSNQVWSENTTIQVIFKNSLFFELGSYF
jgi:hypothetical protein